MKSKVLDILSVIDILFNVLLQAPMNDIFLDKKSVDKFGGRREWISSVFGKNFQRGTLSIHGQRMRRAIDWFVLKVFKQPNHCISQIVN